MANGVDRIFSAQAGFKTRMEIAPSCSDTNLKREPNEFHATAGIQGDSSVDSFLVMTLEMGLLSRFEPLVELFI